MLNRFHRIRSGIVLLIWLAFLQVSQVPVCGQQPARHEKYALLVGVTKYEDSNLNRNPLKFPEADAKAIGTLLERSGYKVELLLGKSATRNAVTKALSAAQKQGTEKGAVLLGFFGHGIQYDNSAYFCPFDTLQRIVKDSNDKIVRKRNGEPKQEPDTESLSSLRAMLDSLAVCGAKNRILLADCCRDAPNRARGRTAFGSSTRLDQLPPGTLVMLACSKGEQAFEHDDWGHGAFSFALLTHAKRLAAKGPVTAGKLADAVYETVKRIVDDKVSLSQTVYSLNSGRVDFLLKLVESDDTAKMDLGKRKPAKFEADINDSAKTIIDGSVEYIRDKHFYFQKSGRAGSPVGFLPTFEYESVDDLSIVLDGKLIRVKESSRDWKGDLPQGVRSRILSFELPKNISQSRIKFVIVKTDTKYELSLGQSLELLK